MSLKQYNHEIKNITKSPDYLHVAASNLKRVSVVGSGVELNWSKTGDVLSLTTLAASAMNELATVFKVEFAE